MAIISVGKNSYGHPSPTVVARWDTVAEVFQTQSPVDNALIDGDTTITTNGVLNFTASASASNRSVTRPMDAGAP